MQGRARTHLGRDIVTLWSRAHGRISAFSSALPEILSFGYATFFAFLEPFCIARYSISAR